MGEYTSRNVIIETEVIIEIWQNYLMPFNFYPEIIIQIL